MEKKHINCPYCNKEIILSVKSKGCIEIDTSFLNEGNQEELFNLLEQKGYEFGLKSGD